MAILLHGHLSACGPFLNRAEFVLNRWGRGACGVWNGSILGEKKMAGSDSISLTVPPWFVAMMAMIERAAALERAAQKFGEVDGASCLSTSGCYSSWWYASGR